MKKLLFGTILGLVIGVVATALVLRHPAKPPESDERPASNAPAATGLHLTKEQQTGSGIAVAQPKPIELTPEARAFGRVLDASPLATLLAEIATARSALTLSSKEFERLKSLGENAAARTLESAEAMMKRDKIALESAQTRMLASWGGALAARTDLESLTSSLLKQESALVRVAMPTGDALATPPTSIRITSITGDDDSREAELIGPAPTAEPQSPGPAYLVLVRGRTPPPGTPLTAWFSKGGARQRGFLLPRSALLQYESDMFVFVQTGEESFQRKRVETSQAQQEGIVVTSGVGAEDRVVVTGAQQLLSEEFKTTSSPE
jgi:hypothetical protein